MKLDKPLTVYILLALLILQAISAIPAGILMIINPAGTIMHMPLSMLNGSPFKTFLIPGIILFAVLGAFPLFSFIILLRLPTWGYITKINLYRGLGLHFAFMCSLFTGFGLLIWIGVEVAFMGYGSLLQGIYAVLGLLILVFTLTPAAIKHCTCNSLQHTKMPVFD